MKLAIEKLDSDVAKSIEQKLKENGGYCPCTLVRNENTKCMCKDFREQNVPGICHCGLYMKYYK